MRRYNSYILIALLLFAILTVVFVARKTNLSPSTTTASSFEELTYGNCHPNNRKRIKPEGVTGDDFWFSYAPFTKDAEFEEMAKKIVSLLPKAEEFLK